MSTPRFPRSPDIHNRPFKDGSNPFRDEQAATTPAQGSSDNLYGASASDRPPPKTPQDYEAFLPNRSRLVLRLGILGALIAGLSTLLAMASFAGASWQDGLFNILPLSLSGIAFAVPAWMMAHADLDAIRAGAMDNGGRRATRLAYWLGLLGTLVGLLPAAGGIVSVVLYFLS